MLNQKPPRKIRPPRSPPHPTEEKLLLKKIQNLSTLLDNPEDLEKVSLIQTKLRVAMSGFKLGRIDFNTYQQYLLKWISELARMETNLPSYREAGETQLETTKLEAGITYPTIPEQLAAISEELSKLNQKLDKLLQLVEKLFQTRV